MKKLVIVTGNLLGTIVMYYAMYHSVKVAILGFCMGCTISFILL